MIEETTNRGLVDILQELGAPVLYIGKIKRKPGVYSVLLGDTFPLASLGRALLGESYPGYPGNSTKESNESEFSEIPKELLGGYTVIAGTTKKEDGIIYLWMWKSYVHCDRDEMLRSRINTW